MKDKEFQKEYGFAYGIIAIEKTKELGKVITETEDGFYWDDGFVKKDFLKDEEIISNDLFYRFLTKIK